MLDELKALREKYKLPKGFLFVPDKLEISITRTSYDHLHLAYKEYFTYLPDQVLDIIMPATVEMLIQGYRIPRNQIGRISKNGIFIDLIGNAAMVTSTVLSELLIQKNFSGEDIEKIGSMGKETVKAFTDSSILEFEWNDKVQEEFFSVLEQLSSVTENNPLMLTEMQEIMKKYTQKLEKKEQ